MAETAQFRQCRRCLMREYDKTEYDDKLSELIASIPRDEKAADALYAQRLAVCKECEQLSTGTCFVCGCYVEMRAAKKNGYCPSRKW